MQTALKFTAPPSLVTKTSANRDRDILVSSLLIATASGDREAFSSLYRHTSSRLFAIALRILRRRELAEEVLQDAYLCIWNRAGSQRHGGDSAYAWMVTVVRHRAIDVIRRQQASREVSMDHEPAQQRLDELDARRISDIPISSCLKALPENQRRALLYTYHYGLTHQELAQTLRVPLGTAKSWVRRGLVQLKAQLDK